MSRKKKRKRTIKWPRGRSFAFLVGGLSLIAAVSAIMVQPWADRRPAAPPAVRVALPPPSVPRPEPVRSPPVTQARILPTPPPAPEPTPATLRTAAAVNGAAPLLEPPAWQKFALPAPRFDGRPMVAVVIDDLGLDRRRAARAVRLPGPLTLAWLPYASEVTVQAAAAEAAGHETLLHAPMQPDGLEDPGPQALMIDMPPDEVRRRIAANLALLPRAVGLNNHMGSRFTRNAASMAPVIAELKARGLMFLDSLTSGSSVAAGMAREAGVPYAVRDVFLDNELNDGYVRARLADLETVARRRRAAVAIGHPHDVTLAALEEWLRTLAARGFVLVPISAIARFRIEHPEIMVRN